MRFHLPKNHFETWNLPLPELIEALKWEKGMPTMKQKIKRKNNKTESILIGIVRVKIQVYKKDYLHHTITRVYGAAQSYTIACILEHNYMRTHE